MAENARASPTCNPRGIDMLEVTSLNPGSGKINLIKLKKTPPGFLTLKSSSLYEEKRTFELVRKHYIIIIMISQ